MSAASFPAFQGAPVETARPLPGPPAGPSGLVPRWVTQLDLAEPVGDLVAPARPGGGSYEYARVLVRLNREPLGTLDLPLLDGRLPVRRLLDAIRGDLERALAAYPAGAVLGPGRGVPKVSVIVATRERADSLAACVRTLCALDYPDYEVLVVDNAPVTDATARAVAALGDQRVRYLVEPRPGASRARNRGARAARGEVLAFTDDDVLADPHWLRGLARGFRRAPGVVCVTGLVPSAELDTEAQLLFDSRVGWGTSCTPRLFDLDEHRIHDKLYPYIPGALGTGANFAVTRQAFFALGAFDEALGPGRPTRGGEDLDFFLRVLLAGHQVAYEPAGLVWHVHRRGEAALRDQLYGYGSGLGAYAFKLVLQRSTVRDVLRHFKRGVRRLSGDAQPRPDGAAMPARLLAVELAGLAAGPVNYLRARREARRA